MDTISKENTLVHQAPDQSTGTITDVRNNVTIRERLHDRVHWTVFAQNTSNITSIEPRRRKHPTSTDAQQHVHNVTARTCALQRVNVTLFKKTCQQKRVYRAGISRCND